jgi:type IV secretory pathway TrbD component
MPVNIGPREHTINRGIFQRTMICGIESDAFVMLVFFTALCLIPAVINMRAMWMYLLLGPAVFGVGYIALRVVYRIDPRFFGKFRSFMLWNTTFRARPALTQNASRRRSFRGNA